MASATDSGIKVGPPTTVPLTSPPQNNLPLSSTDQKVKDAASSLEYWAIGLTIAAGLLALFPLIKVAICTATHDSLTFHAAGWTLIGLSALCTVLALGTLARRHYIMKQAGLETDTLKTMGMCIGGIFIAYFVIAALAIAL